MSRTVESRDDVFHVEPLAPAASAEWGYGADRIRHRSGRFFSIAGLAFVPPGGSATSGVVCQPILDQPEVGTLGFVTRRVSGRVRVLVQEKLEPGNVGGAQLAPTCQATASNLDRVHGGRTTPGAEYFSPVPEGARILADSLQSEQGTRFFRKRNRNVTLELPAGAESPAASAPRLKWMDARRLLGLLARSHSVNTDARSVLVSTPWSAWVGGAPFEEGRDGPARWLSDAYGAPSDAQVAEGVDGHLRWLADSRARLASDAPRLVALEDVPGFAVDAAGLAGPPDARWDVRHFAVRIPSREREAWDQPLVASRGPGLCVLAAFRRNRDVRFLFRAAWEPGLHDLVELQPTICREPGDPGTGAPSPFEAARGAPAIVEAWQSEEGGRFFRERVLHRVVAVGDPGDRLPEGYRSVSLREAERLASLGAFTNEARSTLSLLLSLA